MPKKTITLEQLDSFSVDTDTNQLYWQGKAVMAVMSLPWWVQFSALVASVATAVSAIAAVAALFR